MEQSIGLLSRWLQVRILSGGLCGWGVVPGDVPGLAISPWGMMTHESPNRTQGSLVKWCITLGFYP